MAGMKQLMTAIEEMAETLANSDTALAHLTCREVGSIVDVLVLSGLEQHVGGVLMGHAYGDSARATRTTICTSQTSEVTRTSWWTVTSRPRSSDSACADGAARHVRADATAARRNPEQEVRPP